jgi:glycosyltransferase involved in cell wall biosynthesis
MRLLLAIHNTYTDQTSGAAHSMRTIVEWLAQAGHQCRVLATARFDASTPPNLLAHFEEQGIAPVKSPPAKAFVRSAKRASNLGPGRPTFEFTLNDVPVTMLATTARPNTPADRFEADQFMFLLDQRLDAFAPTHLLTYGGHPVVQESMRRARDRGSITIFSLRNYGYEDRRHYLYADHVLAASPFLARFYHTSIGLRSAGIPAPIDWSAVEAPEDQRRFVTFVNPTLPKGAMLFARLADMLGSRRPDIPVLVVQSAQSAGRLNAISGLDFKKYPHIMAAPATPRPADFFALTRILLVPSAFDEPFGRVAVEAMINGIPPVVSNRGALPETVGDGGIVLSLPAALTPESGELPSVSEVEPWFEAVCALWDQPARYREASAKARAFAEQHYGEALMRQRYTEYFEALERGEPLFDDFGGAS